MPYYTVAYTWHKSYENARFGLCSDMVEDEPKHTTVFAETGREAIESVRDEMWDETDGFPDCEIESESETEPNQ